MTTRTTAEIVVGLRAKANRWPRWFDTCDEAAERLTELLIEIGRLQQENESLKAISGRSGVTP